MSKEELIEFALNKWYILDYKLYESTDSFDNLATYRIFPITIKWDKFILDNIASPNIYESWIMEILLEEKIINWLNNVKEISIPENVKKAYLENLYNKNKTYIVSK